MSRRKHRSTRGGNHRDEKAAVEERDAAGASSPDDPDESDAAASSEPEQGAGAASAELARLEAQAEEMRELALRKQAEFENYRKRMERERSETIQYAASELVKEILPVLDNLERALGAAEAAEAGRDATLREGVSIIQKQFKDILERRGLSEVESQGEAFDPHVHEAVSRVENDEFPEGSVVEVFQKGYRFKDRLLRPAMVSVALPAGGGQKSESTGSPDEDAE